MRTSTPTSTVDDRAPATSDEILISVSPWFLAVVAEMFLEERIEMKLSQRDDDAYDVMLRRAQLA